MKNIKFSIIIPVYNVEKYLIECVNSVLIQSYKNYEIILVDDGSTDKSAQMCDDFVLKNENVSVVHKKNGGLSSARNVGVEKSTGEYLLFLDSDDYWDDCNFLYKVNSLINEKKPDICVFGMKKYYESSDKFVSPERKKISSENTIEYMIKYNYFKASACDKIIKRDLLIKNNITFPVGMFSEDIQWTFDVLLNSKKSIYLNENIYVYRQREGSITKSISDKNILDMLKMFEYGIDKSKELSKDKKNICMSYLAYEYSVALGLISSKQGLKISDSVKRKVMLQKGILKYKISQKVKLVSCVANVFGIKVATKLMGKFIDKKGG